MENTQNLIDKHQTLISILESIQHFENMIKMTTDSINSISGMFPDLHKKYTHNIDTYKRCINRLNDRYNYALNK